MDKPFENEMQLEETEPISTVPVVLPTESELTQLLATAFRASGLANSADSLTPAQALLPWMLDVLLSHHSVTGYGRDLADFANHMSQLGVDIPQVNADHVRLYKAALLKAGARPATVARRLSVLRGVFRQLAAKGFVPWEVAQELSTVKAPPVAKNSTPALTNRQAVMLLSVIDTSTLKGKRDLALLQTFFMTGCRVSALMRACVGHIEFDGVEHYLHVTEKRNKRARKILLDATKPLQTYIQSARIADDREGPLFRPFSSDGVTLQRRWMDRKTPWRLVKHYCRLARIDPDRLDGRGIGVHSLRKTAITDAIRNGAGMHEVRQFAGHSDIRTTELYYVRREEDAELAARRIHIRVNHG